MLFEATILTGTQEVSSASAPTPTDVAPLRPAAASLGVSNGLVAPDGISRCLADWNRGSYPSTRSVTARSTLAELKPQLLAAAQGGADGSEVIGGFDDLVRQLSVGTHLFASLAADPSAMQTLLQVISRAPRLVSTVATRPDVFDALIECQPSADLMSLVEIIHVLAEIKAFSSTDAERLQRIQAFTRKHQFLISARIVLGWTPISGAGAAFSRLATAVVQALASLAERKFQRLHGRLPGSSWALVALGKCGGFELTARSDLDLILVYELGDDDACSTGPQSLPATQYFNKLAQQVIAVLGASDNDGPLFETDFRLRPWGKKGAIATRLSALRSYFETEAWSYEFMAMTRARVITGSPSFSAAIEAVIMEALQRASARSTLRLDVLEMRSLVHTVKETMNPWDIKHVSGGLVDVEFIAQYQMLLHARERDCPVRSGTAEALRALHSAGLLGSVHFEVLSAAHAYYSDVMQAIGAACMSGPLPAAMSNAFATRLLEMMDEGSLDAVEATLCRLQARVQDLFDELVGRLKP